MNAPDPETLGTFAAAIRPIGTSGLHELRSRLVSFAEHPDYIAVIDHELTLRRATPAPEDPPPTFPQASA